MEVLNDITKFVKQVVAFAYLVNRKLLPDEVKVSRKDLVKELEQVNTDLGIAFERLKILNPEAYKKLTSEYYLKYLKQIDGGKPSSFTKIFAGNLGVDLKLQKSKAGESATKIANFLSLFQPIKSQAAEEPSPSPSSLLPGYSAK